MIDFFETHIRFRCATALTAVFALLGALLLPNLAAAQEPESPAFNRKQIEQLVAPIALYPDPLLTHVLMASSYPFEVVRAARWRDENQGLTGGELEQALQEQNWDESVKALTAFPQVLTMMNDKLDWTQKLGEAFLAQQDDVFAAVQELRRRAQNAGNLKDSREMRIVDVPSDSGPSYLEIDSAGPDEMYVPVYDPSTIYGAWPYDDYPPYYWYPHGWQHDRAIWFGAAVVMGVALWAAWDWRHRSIHVDAHRFNTFNRTNVANPAWGFKPDHRKGVPFKAQALTKKFGPIAGPTAGQRAILGKRLNGGVPTKGTTLGTKQPVLKNTSPITTGVDHKARDHVSKDSAAKLKTTVPNTKALSIHKEHTFTKPNTSNVIKKPTVVPHTTRSVPQKTFVQKPVIQKQIVKQPPPPVKRKVDEKH